MFAKPDGQYEDREINCLTCKQPFTFTAGEQAFFDEKQFVETPKRCKPCRDIRKAEREQRAR